MPTLYVANCTRQNFDARYRLEYLPNGDLKPNQQVLATRQMIPSGRQVPLAGEVSMEQVKSLIAQFERFGALAEMDAKQATKRHGRIPLVWNIDQPVKPGTMLLVHDHNLGILTEEGRARRLAAAIVADETLNTAMNAVTPLFEVEIETEDVEVGDQELPTLEEGIRVERPERGDTPRDRPGPQKGRGQHRET